MKTLIKMSAVTAAVLLALAGCDGDDGIQGEQGVQGEQGTQGDQGVQGEQGATGLAQLVNTADLAMGDSRCINGGVLIQRGVDDNSDGVLDSAEVDGESTVCSANVLAVGETTALMPQAGASTEAEDLVDGESADTDFPYGTFKVLATVGEFDEKNKLALTGYPDGHAAWLLDEDTIQVAYQSESYATMSNETYPWVMASGATFTGSHIHTINYNRHAFASFLNNNLPASTMIEATGELFHTVYNVFGEEVDGKNSDTSDLSAKWGNQTAADGTLHEFIPEMQLTEGDFFFHSFCGAHYEQSERFGAGIGFADNVWLNGEEWNIGRSMFAGGNEFAINNTMGLASIAVDVDNQVAYTVPALGQSGYEKILPLNPGHTDYVVIVLSGYNLNVEPAPLKVYVGRKDYGADGNPIDYNTASPRDAFLARNGMLYGQIYGMAVANADYAGINISTVDADTEMLNAFATDTTAPDSVNVRFYPTSYRWTGFSNPVNAGDTEVYKWEQDGDTVDGVTEANEQPTGYTFFNGDSKVEHPAVDPDISKFRYIINLTDADALLGVAFTNLVTELNNASGDLPTHLSASATRIIAGVDGELTLETASKGLAPEGDNNADGTRTHAEHVEDDKAYTDSPDGLQWIKTSDGDFLIVDEDSGNDYGERRYLLPINASDMKLTTANTGYLLAVSGGSLNPRSIAEVAAIPGAFSSATSSEFSGTWNVTHLVAKDADNQFYTQSDLEGTGAESIIQGLPLAEQTLIGVVQQKGESGGIVAARKADQGGQILMYNIDKPLN